MVKVYDGFSCPTIGSITLPVEVGTKCLVVTFVIIPTLDQSRVTWGHPWFSSMKAILSTIHKCLRFPHNCTIITINHNLYQSTTKQENFTLDYFWLKKIEHLKPRN